MSLAGKAQQTLYMFHECVRETSGAHCLQEAFNDWSDKFKNQESFCACSQNAKWCPMQQVD